MDETLAVQSRADTGAFQETDGPILDQPGANPAQDIVTAALLEDHIGDAVILQELPEQQPGRSGADDRDLGTYRQCLAACSGDRAGVSPVVGAAVLLVLTVLVVVACPAILRADAAATEIKIAIHLMLIPNQHIGADGCGGSGFLDSEIS